MGRSLFRAGQPDGEGKKEKKREGRKRRIEALLLFTSCPLGGRHMNRLLARKKKKESLPFPPAGEKEIKGKPSKALPTRSRQKRKKRKGEEGLLVWPSDLERAHRGEAGKKRRGGALSQYARMKPFIPGGGGDGPDRFFGKSKKPVTDLH